MKTHQCPHKDCGKSFPRLYNLKRHLVRIHDAELTTPLASVNKATFGRESKRLSRVVNSVKQDITGDSDCDADTTYGDSSMLINNEKRLVESLPALCPPPVVPTTPVVQPVYSMATIGAASTTALAQCRNENQQFLMSDFARRQKLKTRVADLEKVVQVMTQEVIATHGAQMQRLNSINVFLFQILSEL